MRRKIHAIVSPNMSPSLFLSSLLLCLPVTLSCSFLLFRHGIQDARLFHTHPASQSEHPWLPHLPSVAPHSPWPVERPALIPLAMAIPCSTLASQVVLVIAFLVACSMAPQFVKFPMTPIGAATSLMALLQPPERLVETYQPTAPSPAPCRD